MFKVSPARPTTWPNLTVWQTTAKAGGGGIRLTVTPSVIPNSNYVIVVSDWNCLKYFCVFLYYNRQVHRDFLITLYM
jgi:hypothetical protein